MLRWLIGIALLAAGLSLAWPQIKKLSVWQEAACNTADIRNVASPDGRFVAHVQQESCSGTEPRLRIWLSTRDAAGYHENVFAATTTQWLPDGSRPEQLPVNLAWTRDNELTIYFPKGISVDGDPGRRGIGVEVVYHDETMQR